MLLHKSTGSRVVIYKQGCREDTNYIRKWNKFQDEVRLVDWFAMGECHYAILARTLSITQLCLEANVDGNNGEQ